MITCSIPSNIYIHYLFRLWHLWDHTVHSSATKIVAWHYLETNWKYILWGPIPDQKKSVSGICSLTTYPGDSYKTKIWKTLIYAIVLKRKGSEILSNQPDVIQLVSCRMGVGTEMIRLPLFIRCSCIFNSLIHKSFL